MTNKYNREIVSYIEFDGIKVPSFIVDNDVNIDNITVSSFGDEWKKFNSFSEQEIIKIGNEYFDIVDDTILNKEAIVLDIGCGSGRWDYYLADKVKFIEAIDPSNAVITASKMLENKVNVRVTQASVSNIPFKDESFDFVMSLGVLHHIPDTQQAIIDSVRKLKKGGHFLLYLYYSLDNRNVLYKMLFHFSSIFRFFISKFPSKLKKIVCDIIAFTIYIPLISIAKIVKITFKRSNMYQKFPLSYYIGKSINIIRNDTLDRFGTPLEQRFSKEQIKNMLQNAGMDNILFSDKTPYWHVIAKKN